MYHTNVLMAVGTRFAVVCGATIAYLPHRQAVFAKLRATGHEVVDISLQHLHEFAGNILELAPPSGHVIAMSAGAWRSLNASQRNILESYAAVVPVELPIIEHVGGGGMRCMLAELHLPKREQGV